MIASLFAPNPKLELLYHEPAAGIDRQKPVLFLHGAYSGANCWEPYFLPYFASKGHPAYALSFRAHGGSDGHALLHWTRISDYLQDLLRTESKLSEEPILIGHSMGALVLQRYLENHHPPAAVMMAPVPPSGLLASILRLWMHEPVLMQQLHLAQFAGTQLINSSALRAALFRPDTSAEALAVLEARLQPESLAALMDMNGLALPTTKGHSPCPLLVMGGSADSLISVNQLQSAAKAYGLEAEVLTGMPHAMMLDSDWQLAADRILGWLRETLISAGDRPR